MMIIIVSLVPQPLLREQCAAHSACRPGTQVLYLVNLGPTLRLLRQICELDLRSTKAWAGQRIWAWPASRRQARPIRFSISGSEIKKDTGICQLEIEQKLQSCLEGNLRSQWAKAICMEEFGEASIWRRVRGEPTGKCRVLWSSPVTVMLEPGVKSHRLFFVSSCKDRPQHPSSSFCSRLR